MSAATSGMVLRGGLKIPYKPLKEKPKAIKSPPDLRAFYQAAFVCGWATKSIPSA